MRIAERTDNTSGRSYTRYCDVPDCGKSTREGKPFCSEHVELNAYATLVVREIRRRDSDDEDVRRKAVPVSDYNLQGITARSIIQYLGDNGPRTEARICKDLGIDSDILDGYAAALIREGKVSRGHTNRGNATLELVRSV